MATESKIQNWDQAEEYARRYADAISEAEQIEEALKAFAESRCDQVGKKRELGPAILGFEKIASTVRVPAEALGFLRDFYPKFGRPKFVADVPALKKFFKSASTVLTEKFFRHGIVPVAGYQRFFCRLARVRPNGDES